MTIEISHIERVRYPPELIPGADVFTIAANAQQVLFDIQRLPPGIIAKIDNIAADHDQAGQLRLKADVPERQLDARPLYDMSLRSKASLFNLIATKSLHYYLFAIAGLTDYMTWYGIWAWKQTVADKLRHGLSLSAEDRRIDDEYGVSKTVERGTLPPCLDRIFMYEYYPLYEWTETSRETVPVTGLELDTIRPVKGRDTFVALTRVSADQPPAVAGNTRITICRDDDGSAASPFIELPTYTLKGGLADEIPMFVPALRDIRLRVETGIARVDYNIRWTYAVYPMTNILRVRFGLVSRDEVPGDLYDKVMAGIA